MRRAARALGRRHAVSVQGSLGGIDATPWATTSQIESRLRHAARHLQQGWRSSTLEQRVTRFFADSHFRSPTPIQAQCLPLAIGGRDLIAISPTGSGKTIAFMLPALWHVAAARDEAPNLRGPLGLVLAPTRELVRQLHGVVRPLATSLGCTVAAAHGGKGSAPPRRLDLLIGTPSRVLELCLAGSLAHKDHDSFATWQAGVVVTRQGESEDAGRAETGGRRGGRGGAESGEPHVPAPLDLRSARLLVLDDADRFMRSGELAEQLAAISRHLPPSRAICGVARGRQTLMFSATWPKAADDAARAHVHDPLLVRVGGDADAVPAPDDAGATSATCTTEVPALTSDHHAPPVHVSGRRHVSERPPRPAGARVRAVHVARIALFARQVPAGVSQHVHVVRGASASFGAKLAATAARARSGDAGWLLRELRRREAATRTDVFERPKPMPKRA